MAQLVGKRVKLLVDAPPFERGTICVVKNELTYADRVLPEDPLVLKCDGAFASALRKEVEVLDE